MKTRIALFFGLGLIAGSAFSQLPRIVVEGNGAPQVFTQLDDAVAAAQPNDKLYLSGGTFTYAGNYVLDKPLHLIGAGIHPDSTGVTGTTTLQTLGNTSSSLRITTAASGSTFTGIRFVSSNGAQSSYAVQYGLTTDDDDVADVVFQRCWFQGRMYLGSSTIGVVPTTTTFNECVFLGEVNGFNRSGIFTRCIIANGFGTITLTAFAGSSTIENCVVLGTIQSNVTITIRDSFLRTNGSYAAYACNSCIFQNNITPSATVASTSPGAVFINNLVNVDASTVFVSETNGLYEVTDDLHMAPGSPGIGHATDGNDIGIYGSSSPYKPGAVPFNPHFRQVNIAGGTDTNGALPVNIKVAAQPN